MRTIFVSKLIRIFLLLAAVLWLFVPPVFAAQSASPLDLRLLVDVSGSMRISDPNGLRGPALRRVAEALPDGSYAGVWTFGRYVNMQVPYGRVDSRWRARVYDEANKIHAWGRFSNIEESLVRATWNWHQADADRTRVLILLSDGHIDISQDARLNAASRQRILEKLLPRLKKAGVVIHTIALSADADRELMRTLSQQTGGKAVIADTTEDLDQIYFGLLGDVIPELWAPFQKQRFKIAGTEGEVTIIARRSESELTLLTPTHQQLAYGRSSDGILWRREQGYDVITLKNPAKGEWGINRASDASTPVFVIANLRLHVEPIGGQYFVGEHLSVNVRISYDKLLTPAIPLLGLLSVQASTGTAATVDLSRISDGVYGAKLPLEGEAGDRLVHIAAILPGLRHIYEKTIRLDAIPFVLNQYISSANSSLVQLVISRRPDARFEVERIALHFAGTDRDLGLKASSAGQWLLELPAHYRNERFDLHVGGKTASGRSLKLVMRGRAQVAVRPAPIAQPDVAQPAPLKAAHKQILADYDLRWQLVLILVLVLNVLLMASAIFWRALRRSHAAREGITTRAKIMPSLAYE